MYIDSCGSMDQICCKLLTYINAKEADVGVEFGSGIDRDDGVESEDKGTIKIRVDRVTEPVVSDDVYESASVDMPESTDERGLDGLMQKLYDHLVEIGLECLDRDNMKLRDMLCVEREWIDSLRRHMAYINQEELRQIRRFRYYDRMKFRRLETYARICLGHSLPDSSVDAPATISVGPSRKRSKSPAISVPIKGAVTASDYDDSTKGIYEAYTEPNNDSDVQADIDVDITADEAIKIRVDRVTEPVVSDDVYESVSDDMPESTDERGLDGLMQKLYDHLVKVPVQRITDIK
nr:hypothetical protein [Tanacetum cinerariifolium]